MLSAGQSLSTQGRDARGKRLTPDGNQCLCRDSQDTVPSSFYHHQLGPLYDHQDQMLFAIGVRHLQFRSMLPRLCLPRRRLLPARFCWQTLTSSASPISTDHSCICIPNNEGPGPHQCLILSTALSKSFLWKQWTVENRFLRRWRFFIILSALDPDLDRWHVVSPTKVGLFHRVPAIRQKVHP